MATPLKVGLAGLGTVGASVVRLIDQQRAVRIGQMEADRPVRRRRRVVRGDDVATLRRCLAVTLGHGHPVE